MCPKHAAFYPGGRLTTIRHKRNRGVIHAEFATQVVDLLNGLIWGKILIWLLVGCGLYFTVRLGLIQFRHFGHTFSVLRAAASRTTRESPRSRRSAPLAARVGTGNVAGVAVPSSFDGVMIVDNRRMHAGGMPVAADLSRSRQHRIRQSFGAEGIPARSARRLRLAEPRRLMLRARVEILRQIEIRPEPAAPTCRTTFRRH